MSESGLESDGGLFGFNAQSAIRSLQSAVRNPVRRCAGFFFVSAGGMRHAEQVGRGR